MKKLFAKFSSSMSTSKWRPTIPTQTKTIGKVFFDFLILAIVMTSIVVGIFSKNLMIPAIVLLALFVLSFFIQRKPG